MLRINEDSGAVIGLWTDGKPTSEQLSNIHEELKQRIAKSGNVRLLVRLRNTDTWSASALLDILGLSQAFGRGIERLAVVGQRCSDCTWDLLALLYQRTAFFHSDRLEQAWLWLRSKQEEEALLDEQGPA
jgi:hypothetical protein